MQHYEIRSSELDCRYAAAFIGMGLLTCGGHMMPFEFTLHSIIHSIPSSMNGWVWQINAYLLPVVDHSKLCCGSRTRFKWIQYANADVSNIDSWRFRVVGVCGGGVRDNTRASTPRYQLIYTTVWQLFWFKSSAPNHPSSLLIYATRSSGSQHQ